MSFFYSAQGIMVAQPVAKPTKNNIENFWQSLCIAKQATDGTRENYAGVDPTFVIDGNYKNSCFKCKALFSSCKRDKNNTTFCDFYCEGCVKNGITLDKKTDRKAYCAEPNNLKNCDKALKTKFKLINSATSPNGIITNTGETINYNSACSVLETVNYPFILQPDKTCKQNRSYGLSDEVQGGGQAVADAAAAKAVADAAVAKAVADAAVAKAVADAAVAKATADAAAAQQAAAAAAQQAAVATPPVAVATQPAVAATATATATQPAAAVATQPAAAVATQPAAAVATQPVAAATQPAAVVAQPVAVPQVVQQFTQRFTEKFTNSINDRISDYIFRH